MRAWLRRSVLVSCAIALACSPTAGGSYQLEPDAVLVLRSGPLVNDLTRSNEIGVIDVDADGDRVALLFLRATTGFSDRWDSRDDPSDFYIYQGSSSSTSMSFRLALSEDAGASWTVHDLDATLGYHHYVHLYDGRVFLVVMGYDETALGGESFHVVHELFPETGEIGPQIGQTFPYGTVTLLRNEVSGYGVVTIQTPPDANVFPDNPVGHATYRRLDLDTGEWFERDDDWFPATELRCGAASPFLTPNDGTRWDALVECRPYHLAPEHAELCASSAWPRPAFWHDPASSEANPTRVRCTPNVDFPGWAELSRREAGPWVGGGDLWQLFTRDGHNFAVRFEDARPETRYLGTGERDLALANSSSVSHPHHRFARLLLLHDSSGDRLVHFDVDGSLYEVPLPRSPCSTSTCGTHPREREYGSLHWAARRAEDDWILVYVIDEGDERLSDLGFYVRRVEVPREPLTATAPPGLIPEEMPGCSPSLTTRPTEIEAACARWAACPSPTAPYRQGIDLCVAHVIGASETERATFLASEPCTADPPPPVVGVAIDGCDGDRITGTSASGTVTVADCALLGLTCVRDALTGNPTCGGNGECAVATDNGGGDTYQYGACQGSRLFYRIFGRGTGALRYVDCAELGLGWCGVSRLELAPHEYEFVANCGYEPPEEPVEPGPLVGGVPAGAVELACARAATCATDPNSFQSCLFLQTYGWSMAGDDASDEPHQELLAATTCDDFARALPGLVPPPVRSCSGTGARCVDDAAYGCTSGELVAQGDCEQYGAICSVSGGIASCGAPAGACPEPLTTRTCGSAGGLCTPPGWMSIDGGGALTYEDCMGRGLACMGDGLGGYGCFRPTTECTARESGSRCVGELVVSCEAPGVGRIGARCDRIPGFACARSPLNPADSACVPAVSDCSGTISQCDGDVLRYCLSGSTRALDCATIGATCRSSGGIASCVAE